MTRLNRIFLGVMALASAFFINWVLVKTNHGLLLYILLASAASFTIHVLDKRKAIAGLKRLPEWQLLSFDAFGGWSGGLIARGFVGYSSLKNGFRNRFALVVILNISSLLCAAWMFPDLILV
ncbi:hypothetical protein BLL42_27505 (plasmid) [Pseudomonas frederiksbergensis]|uniref:DUF1294 domain-containing protein n=1 Tax=Pseudomonas frederiksbergensis TaxID=104087 RepID=A0A1J0EUL7_9PSED|nr:DUF1294 domain-containing protein [Pseudomonas frederiksbergensis]APC19484.1 hypothetical protein BLL42_27505 [Pseudomonas frederiksbergensis]